MSEQFSDIIEINEEEMVDFIHAKMREEINKAVIIEVLSQELEFLKSKGVIES